MKKRFRVLLERRSEFYQWVLHNVIFGLAGVWMPFVVLLCFGKWRIKEIFTDGSLLIFTVTLSAVSLGFFFKETRVSLRKAHTLTYSFLMITMILSALCLTALFIAPITAVSNPPMKLYMPFIYWTTAILVVLAVYFNFRLFMAELTGTDVEVIADRYNTPTDNLTIQAQTATSANGVQL